MADSMIGTRHRPGGATAPWTGTVVRTTAAWGPLVVGAGALWLLVPAAQFPSLPAATVFALLVYLAPDVYAFRHGGRQTLAATVILPGILLFGPVPAALLAGVALVAKRLNERLVPDWIAHSAGQRVVATLVAGAALSAVAEGHPILRRAASVPSGPHALAAMAALGLGYACTSALLVALRHSSRRQERLSVLVRENAPFDVLGTLAAGMAGAAVALPMTSWPPVREIDAVGPVFLSSLVGYLVLLLRATARQTAELRNAVADLLRTPDLDELLQRLADHVARIAPPDLMWIVRRGRDGAPTVVLARGADVAAIEALYAAPAPHEAGTVGGAGRTAGGLRWTFDTRVPVLIDEYRRDERFSPRADLALGADNMHSVLVAPLVVDEELLGALVLVKQVAAYFTESHRQSVSALAAQASLTMKNASLSRATATLLRETEHRAHELALINRIVARVAGLLRPEELFDTLVEELHVTLGYPLVSISLVEGDRLRTVATRGVAVPAGLPLDRGIIGRVVRTGRAELVEDVSGDPDYVPADPRVAQNASVPIAGDAGVEGVICVETIERVLTRSDLNLLSTLAAQVREAMRNAALFAEIRQARDELEGLYESAQALSRSLELAQMLDGLLTVTCRRFDYQHAAILLLDGKDLIVRAVLGCRRTPGQRIAIGWEAEGRAAAERRPVVVAEDGTCASTTLAVPLLRENRVVGVFSVAVDRAGGFCARDERIMTLLAGYAAVAIENAELYEQTRDLAATDGLTGLLNHRSFWQTITAELERARRYRFPLALIVVEIDRFKRYNDAYGHLRGDEVLRLIARVIEREHRSRIDTVARYGGDEFMLLLPHTSKASAIAVAERVRASVESTPYIVDGEPAAVTVSLGVALFPEDGDTANALVEAADRRMYGVKRLGGNRVAAA